MAETNASTAAPHQAEAQRVTVIRPVRGWLDLGLREAFGQRELLWFFTWRDLKVRYKQTALGVAWAVIDPIVTTIVFTIIFGGLAGLNTDGVPPQVFYLAGLVIWKFLASTVTQASNSLVTNSNMLTKIYFPRLLLPASGCMTALVDFLVALGALLVLLLIIGMMPAATILLTPLLVVLTGLTAMGISLWLAALNVRYRDVRNVVPLLVQIWMYLSVIVPFSQLPARWGAWRYLYGLNPMAGIVEMFRWCVLHTHLLPKATAVPLGGNTIPAVAERGQSFAVRVLPDLTTQVMTTHPATGAVPPPVALLLVGLPVTLALVAVGLLYFRRVEKQFADVV